MEGCNVSNITENISCLTSGAKVTEEISVPEWITYTKFLFTMTIFLLGVPGNGIIVLVQAKNRKKSTTDYLIITMAICDLILASVIAPLLVLQCFKEVWNKLLTDLTCKFYQYTIFTTTFASTQLLAAVAFDRYRCTCKPHSKLFNPEKAKILSIAILLASATICGAVFFIAGINEDKNKCGTMKGRRIGGVVFRICMSLLFLAMFLIVMFCYSMVAFTLRQRHRQKLHTRQGLAIQTAKASIFDKKNKVGAVELVAGRNNLNTRNVLEQRSDSMTRREIGVLPVTSCFDKSVESKTEDDNTVLPGNSRKDFDCLASPSVIGCQMSDTLKSQKTTVQSRNLIVLKQTSPRLVRKLAKEETKINKTTVMMLLITATYTLTWVLVWSTSAYASIGENAQTLMGVVSLELLSSTYMINTIANPIFYIIMSSAFRERVVALFCRNSQRNGLQGHD